MFKVGDIVQFSDGLHKLTVCEVLLVGPTSLLVRIGRGKGHDGFVNWTAALGWQRDETHSCWFVGEGFATIVKSKPSFKGNIK